MRALKERNQVSNLDSGKFSRFGSQGRAIQLETSHNGIDAAHLLEDGHHDRDDKVRPVAGFPDLHYGVPYKRITLGIIPDILKLLLYIFLTSELLQDLHADGPSIVVGALWTDSNSALLRLIERLAACWAEQLILP